MHGEFSDSIINTVILTAKRFIWCQKFSAVSPNLLNYCKFLVQHLCTMQLVHTFKNEVDEFNKTWGDIYFMLNMLVEDSDGG